jgi:glycosyltransferase involved in cell wall biosynthesis
MKLAHVTLYPPKGEKHVSGSGVASYSKNLITHLSGPSVDQTVICNIITAKQSYEEGGISIHRTFERNPSFLVSTHKELKRVDPDVVHFQQELALFGNIVTAYLLQWLVFLWRKKAVITLHGVVDPNVVDKTFVKENNSGLPVWLVKIAFRVIYTPLMKWPRKVIVHEQHFKDIAINSYGIDPAKVAVIPHGVEMLETIDEVDAREVLNIPKDAEVVLFMGYATGYKGIDLLIEGFATHAKTHPKAYLIMGAGKHPKLLNDQKYEAEYARLKSKAAKLLSSQQYTWEGFIKESEITVYYSASDLSIYPYTTALSSSGPMSFAIGYEKPFLVSTAFESIFSEYPQLLFERQADDLSKRLAYFFSHRDEYARVSSELRQRRNWEQVGGKTLQVYSEHQDREGAYETEKSVTTG